MTSAEQVAGDLAMAIFTRAIRPGERLPTHKQIIAAYTTSATTANRAVAMVVAAGLATSHRGQGGVVAKDFRSLLDQRYNQIVTAANMLRVEACSGRVPGRRAAYTHGGSPDWGTMLEDEETMPPITVEVDTLTGIDRNVLRWMSEELMSAARLLVLGHPPAAHLNAAVTALLDHGGTRPADQSPIALMQVGQGLNPDEDVVLRLWPERAHPRADGAPF